MSESPQTLAQLGEPIVAARSAEIYHWRPQQILKLFREDFCHKSADQERLNAEEAYALGATLIECIEAVELNGRRGIVMKRLDGKTLTAIVDDNPLNVFRLPRTLARLHVQVHQANTQKLPDIRGIISDYLNAEVMSFLTAEEKNKAQRYLQSLPDGNTLLHMDFHTENILVSNDQETVIDWATAARGHVGADLAMTWFLFHEAELFPGISKAQELLYNSLRRIIYRYYRKHYQNIQGLTHSELQQVIDRWYLAAIICRLAMWSAPSEVDRLQKKIRLLISQLPGGNN